MNIKTLVDKINETESGKKIFINALGINEAQANCIRGLISKGVLIPDTDNYMIPEEVASGHVILPQNFYTVNKGVRI